MTIEDYGFIVILMLYITKTLQKHHWVIFGGFDMGMTALLENPSNIGQNIRQFSYLQEFDYDLLMFYFCFYFGLIQAGLPNGMALLYMGIVTGMMSAVIASRRDIEKVNEKLKWTKNLVLELEEELIVKEIADDDYENPNLYSPSMSAVDEPTRQTSESTNHVTAENHESMSEIEAELEAELERLEMNLKVPTLERISDFVELDPEDEVDVAQGDLKLDCLDVQSPASAESDWDTSETSIVHSKPANYPVSPRELSLRLHEVIESRLEARIKELETALHHSQNRACSFKTQHIFSQKDYISSQSEFFADLQSPHCYHEADEETIRTMHGTENTFYTDTRISPFDGGYN